MQIIIVRHGISEWNTIGRWQGQKDTPLSEKGMKQAKEMAKALSEIKIDKIYSSDITRCVQTAEEINKGRNLEIITRPELREIDIGVAEGLFKQEIKKKKWYIERLKDKYDIPFPEGESYADVAARLKPFLEKILDRDKSSTILLVSHEASGRAIIGNLLGMKNAEIPKISVPHKAIYFIDTANRKAEYEIGGVREEGVLKR